MHHIWELNACVTFLQLVNYFHYILFNHIYLLPNHSGREKAFWRATFWEKKILFRFFSSSIVRFRFGQQEWNSTWTSAVVARPHEGPTCYACRDPFLITMIVKSYCSLFVSSIQPAQTPLTFLSNEALILRALTNRHSRSQHPYWGLAPAWLHALYCCRMTGWLRNSKNMRLLLIKWEVRLIIYSTIRPTVITRIIRIASNIVCSVTGLVANSSRNYK